MSANNRPQGAIWDGDALPEVWLHSPKSERSIRFTRAAVGSPYMLLGNFNIATSPDDDVFKDRSQNKTIDPTTASQQQVRLLSSADITANRASVTNLNLQGSTNTSAASNKEVSAGCAQGDDSLFGTLIEETNSKSRVKYVPYPLPLINAEGQDLKQDGMDFQARIGAFSANSGSPCSGKTKRLARFRPDAAVATEQGSIAASSKSSWFPGAKELVATRPEPIVTRNLRVPQIYVTDTDKGTEQLYDLSEGSGEILGPTALAFPQGVSNAHVAQSQVQCTVKQATRVMASDTTSIAEQCIADYWDIHRMVTYKDKLERDNRVRLIAKHYIMATMNTVGVRVWAATSMEEKGRLIQEHLLDNYEDVTDIPPSEVFDFLMRNFLSPMVGVLK